MASGPAAGPGDGPAGGSVRSTPTVELVAAAELDYEAYAEFQRTAFKDLVARGGASDSHMTAAFYRWKYHPPEGPARIARIAVGERVLSSSAMLPLRISCGGKTAVGWHCVDVATLPEARRRGLLMTTLQALRDSVPAGDLFFAFPNAGSIGAFHKLGCREHGVVTTWVNPWVRAVAETHRRIGTVDRFEAIRDSVGSAVDMDRTHVDRSVGYLDWRYSDHPGTRYVTFAYRDRSRTGFCVARRARAMNRDFSLVMELHGSGPGVRTALLRHTAAWGLSEGRSMMVVMDTGMSPITALGSMLAPIPSFLLPKRQALVVAEGGDHAEDTTRRWLVQTGDWDVF